MVQQQRVDDDVELDDSPAPAVPGTTGAAPADAAQAIRLVRDAALSNNDEYKRYRRGSSEYNREGLKDFLFLVSGHPAKPTEVFNSLRWGGQVIYITRQEREATELLAQYQKLTEYIIEQPVAHVQKSLWGLKLPFLTKNYYYFIARKVSLIQPGETTERFTYHLELVRAKNPADGYVVLKAVPDHAEVVGRLRGRFPNMAREDIEERARKFTDKVFPIFLTREAAILRILYQHLPEPYRSRIPKVHEIVKDEKGYVRKLHMQWLRNSGEPMSQMEFAKQSSDLLRMFHDEARVIHLDLRLDNFVVTERGVGFIDFGSSVRVGEKLEDSQLLSTLFEEMMRTSQIQRMLGAMTTSGMVTSRALCSGLHKVDKAVDVFYLAVQMNKPHSNPDFRGLVNFDANSHEARAIADLTKEILKPKDPENPTYKTADDILRGLQRIEKDLKGAAKPVSAGA